VLHEQENRINSWFHEKSTVSFAKYVCDASINNCRVELIESLKNKKDSTVEVEDAPPAKSKTEASKKKADEPGKKSTNNTKEQGSSFKPSDIVQLLFNRVKNNMLRLRVNSVDLYREVHVVVKARNWAKLKTMAKDANFWRKYWNVFMWAFIFIYFFVSVLETVGVFGKGGKSSAKKTGERRTKRKARKDE